MPDDNVGVVLTADTKSFVQGFNDAANAVGHLGKVAAGIKGAVSGAISAEMTKVRNVALATGAALVATGLRVKSSIGAFAQFQTNMQNVATVADTSVASIGKLSEGVRQLAISGKVTQNVNQLSEGLYNIVSSGFQGADAMKILNQSAQAASAGLTDTVTAGTAVTQILNAYGLSASAAQQVSDDLFHTVNVGVLNFQQLAQTTGQWASVSATLKVPLGEATAALAAMTKAGSDADAAATSLRTMMLAFINPSDQMSKLLTRIGYSSGVALVGEKGLAGALDTVVKASGGGADALQNLFQDVQGLNGVLQLTGPQAGFFASEARKMSDGVSIAGETTKALAQQQKSLSAQWSQFTNQLTEMKLELGSLLAPLASAAVGFGTHLLGSINSLPGPIREVIAGFSLLTPALAVLSAAYVLHAAKAFVVGKAISGLVNPLRELSIVAKFPSIGRGLDVFEQIARKGVLRTVAGGITDIIRSSTTLTSALAKLATTGAVVAGSIAAFALVLNTLWVNYNKADAAGQKLAETLSKGARADDATTFKDLNSQLDAVQQNLAKTKNDFSGLGGAAKAFYGGVQLINPFDNNTVGRDISEKENLEAIGNQLIKAKNAAQEFKIGNESVQDSMNRLVDAAGKGAIDLQGVIDTYDKFIGYVTKIQQGKTLSPAEIQDYHALQGQIAQTKDALEGYNKEQIKTQQVTHASSAVSQNLAEDLKKIADTATEAKDKAAAYSDIIQQLQDRTMGTRNAQAAAGQALRDFLQDVSDLRHEGKDLKHDMFDPFTESGGKIQGALSNISQAMGQWATSIYNTTGSASEANNALVAMAGGFIQVAKQAGFSAAEIQTMLTLMGLTPDTISTLVQIPGADQAIAVLGTVQQQLNDLNGSVSTATLALQVVTQIASPANGGMGVPGDPFVTDQLGGANTVQDQVKKSQDQILDMIKQIQQGVSSGVTNASKGFTPTVPKGQKDKKEKDQTLTPEEAAAYAYQVGFRGADLVRIVAIMGRESGYNPKAYNPNSATGDLSYGLTQINMIGSMGPQRRAQFGIGQNEDLFDPLTNLRAAYIMYKQAGNQLTPWGGYKGKSDTYNTDMAAAQQAVANFLANQGNYGGGGAGSGVVSDFIDVMEQHALTTMIGGIGQAAKEANNKARQSVLENMAGAYSRVGQGIINNALQTGQDPTDEFNKVADAFDNLTKKVGKDTAVQLLYYAQNAEEYTSMADEIIHQAELQANKEDYLYKHGQMSKDDYKAILNARLAMTEQYSQDWISIMDQLQAVDDDFNKAQAEKDAKQRKMVENQYAMNEMSREDYIRYLADLITHYDKYSDEYMDIWNKLHDLQQQQRDAEKQLTDDLVQAWQTAYTSIADPIKSATSLVAAFGNSMDVTSDQIKDFYGHMKEATQRWTTAITSLKQSGLDPGLLADLIKQGPQSLTLAETLVGMGSSGIGFVNGALGDINAMTQQFGQSLLPAANIGQYVDNKVSIQVGDVTVTAPGNVGISQSDLVSIVNQAFGLVVQKIQSGQKV